MIQSALQAVILPVLIHYIIVFGAVCLSLYLPELAPAGFVNPFITPSIPFIDKFVKWDAHWYTYIAQYGYDDRSIVFFPMIVMLIRGLAYWDYHVAVSGFIVCNAFAIGSFVALYLLIRQDYSPFRAKRILYAYAVMPTSFFLNSIYTESIFLSFSLATFYYIRKDHWWLAGIFAALATLTRNLGIFLVGVIMLEFIIEFWRQSHRPYSKLCVLIALPISALSGFMAYNYWKVGNAIAFFSAQKVWGRQFEYPWINYWNNLLLLKAKDFVVEPGIALDALLVVMCFISLLIPTLFYTPHIRLSYLVIGWIWFLVPMFSTSPWYPLYSMSRFILAIFPIYIFIAHLSRSIYYLYLVSGSILLFFCTIFFASWRWIG